MDKVIHRLYINTHLYFYVRSIFIESWNEDSLKSIFNPYYLLLNYCMIIHLLAKYQNYPHTKKKNKKQKKTKQNLNQCFQNQLSSKLK